MVIKPKAKPETVEDEQIKERQQEKKEIYSGVLPTTSEAPEQSSTRRESAPARQGKRNRKDLYKL